jgi:hypothetical protein
MSSIIQQMNQQIDNVNTNPIQGVATVAPEVEDKLVDPAAQANSEAAMNTWFSDYETKLNNYELGEVVNVGKAKLQTVNSHIMLKFEFETASRPEKNNINNPFLLGNVYDLDVYSRARTQIRRLYQQQIRKQIYINLGIISATDSPNLYKYDALQKEIAEKKDTISETPLSNSTSPEDASVIKQLKNEAGGIKNAASMLYSYLPKIMSNDKCVATFMTNKFETRQNSPFYNAFKTAYRMGSHAMSKAGLISYGIKYSITRMYNRERDAVMRYINAKDSAQADVAQKELIDILNQNTIVEMLLYITNCLIGTSFIKGIGTGIRTLVKNTVNFGTKFRKTAGKKRSMKRRKRRTKKTGGDGELYPIIIIIKIIFCLITFIIELVSGSTSQERNAKSRL